MKESFSARLFRFGYGDFCQTVVDEVESDVFGVIGSR